MIPPAQEVQDDPEKVRHTLWADPRYPGLPFVPVAPRFDSGPFNCLSPPKNGFPIQGSGSSWKLAPATVTLFQCLEDELRRIEHALRSKLELERLSLPPRTRPFPFPKTFGYDRVHQTYCSVQSAVRKSRDAFLALMGMCSFLITFFQDNVPQHGVDIFRWESILQQAKFSVDYIKAVKASELTNFRSDYSRVGVFIQHFDPHFQHFVSLYIKYNVPVWIHWGNVNNGAPQHTGVLTRFLPFDSEVSAIRRAHTNESRGVATPNMKNLDARAVEGTVSVSVCSDTLPEPDKSSRQKRGELWHEFFSRMDAEKINALKKENLKARQTRINREHAQKSQPLPGTNSSATFFEWEEDVKTGFLLRKPISRNHARDVWSGYSMNQRRFNSVRNEWDLCSKFSDADFSDCESDDSTYPKGTNFQRSLPHPTSTIPIPSSTSSPGDDIPMSEPGKTDGDECAPEVIEQATSGIPMSEPGETGGDERAPEVFEIEQATSGIPMSEPEETSGDERAPEVFEIEQVTSDIPMSEPRETGGDERAPEVSEIEQATSGIPMSEPGKTGGDERAPEVIETEQATSDIPMSELGETSGDERAPEVSETKQATSDIPMSEPGETGGDECAPKVTSDVATEPGTRSASPPLSFTGRLVEDIYEYYGFIGSRDNGNVYEPTLEWSAVRRILKDKSAEDKTWKTVQMVFGDPESSVDPRVRIPLTYFVAGLLDPDTNPLAELTSLWDLAVNSVSPLVANINPNFRLVVQSAPSCIYFIEPKDTSNNDVRWQLVLENPAAVLVCFRQRKAFSIRDVALFLLRQGMPFSTRLRRRVICSPRPSYPQVGTLGWRRQDDKPTVNEYRIYQDNLKAFLAHTPRSRAAYLKGALIARLAMESSGADDERVLKGPSEEVLVRGKRLDLVNEADWWDDELSDMDMDIICGVYESSTGKFVISALVIHLPNLLRI
jgi:hypothetical protein